MAAGQELPQPIDVSMEAYRIYTFHDGKVFRINNPVQLYIVGGSHRVVDAEGLTHRPERGYVGISWAPKPGQPPFVA